ncbi:hypothetical protein pb186bvf_020819 [Paramecium bursaria]
MSLKIKIQQALTKKLETIHLNIIVQPRTQKQKPRYKQPNNKPDGVYHNYEDMFSKGVNMEQDNVSLEMRTLMVYYMIWI